MTHYPRVGDHFGAFLITGEIGHGGMGVVLAARQTHLNRQVALKVLDPRFSNDPAFVQRFAQEGELLAKLNSPHVIQIYDHGQIGDCLYLAMQHVTGGDLSRYLHQRGPLPISLAADLTGQVASALADAHALGVIHRDIKPGNILLTTTGSDPFVYLCDFGIAQGDHHQGLTQAGMLAGSMGYTAPERHEGHPADERSDLYSLGCLFWALLTGSAPYAGTDFQIAHQHLTSAVPQLSGTTQLVSATNHVLASLLAKDPRARPSSAVEVVATLRQLQRLGEGDALADRTIPIVTGYDTVPRPVPRPDLDWDPTTVHNKPVAAMLGQAPPVQRAEAATQEPPRSARPGAPARKRRTALTAGAIVLVAALIGGGGLWVVTNGLPGAAPAGVIGPTATTPAPAPTTRVLPTATGRAAATSMATEINLDESPHGIAVDPESRLAFIANYNDSSVSVVNLDSNSIVRKLSVGAQPQNVLVDTASGLLLVGCDGVPAVQIYDLRGYNLVGSVSTGKGPIRMAVHSAQRVAYAVAQGSSKMEVISLTNYKLVKTVEVGKSPRVVAVDERGDIAYVGHWDSTLVSMVGLGTQQKVGELTVGRNPNGIAIAAEGRKAFVASFGDGKDGGGSVSVIDLDTRKVVKTLGVDSGPSRVVVDESASVAYVSCLYAARIDVIDTTSLAVVDRVETAKRPTGVAVDPSTGDLYVTSFDEYVVQIFQP